MGTSISRSFSVVLTLAVSEWKVIVIVHPNLGIYGWEIVDRDYYYL